MTNTTSNKPIKKIRVGSVTATIWAQERRIRPYRAQLQGQRRPRGKEQTCAVVWNR